MCKKQARFVMDDKIFGFNIYSKPIEELLEYTVQHNLRHIEIHPSKSHSSVESFTEERVKRLLEITKKNKISLSIHIPHNINISDIIPPIRKKHIARLTEYLHLSQRLNALYVTLHIGSFFWFPIENQMRSRALKRFVKNIKPFVKYCEEQQIVLALENSVPLPCGTDYYYLGDNIYDFEFLFDQLKSDYVAFCLDTGHANVAEGIEDYISKFGDKIFTIHYHDNNKNNDEHLPVGEGNINWELFSKLMKEKKFKGPFISECRNQLPHQSAEALKKIL